MNSGAVCICHVSHRYGKTVALRDISLSLPVGCSVGVVGPDGVGKSTLLSLLSGIKILQDGEIRILGQNIAAKGGRELLMRKIAFMPQGLGQNLYPSLSVYENMDFHARLFSLPAVEKEAKINRLLTATALIPFKDRAAGKLSGGMKQKLSLCCALIHDPQLLILDEPTTGVDPLSRRQFWHLVAKLRRENPQMTVIVATAYIEEAKQFDYLLAMDNGTLLANAPTREIIQQYGGSIESAYNHLLPADKRGNPELHIPPFIVEPDTPPVMQACGLTKKFGHFTAVDNVSFTIRKGEIFGFLGSNGCGKSTTMKMLTGLLEPDAGTAQLLGKDIDAGGIESRMRVGYMSQAFSLYEEMSVQKNLQMHAKLYRLTGEEGRAAVADALTRYGLREAANTLPRYLPLGIKQRLQLAAACLHRPEILILDEPTSGVDPAARDHFWEELIRLSRQERITIFVSTHFMSEAARCDRISFMHRGKVLDIGTPETLRQKQQAASLEDAFIKYLEVVAKDSTENHRETPASEVSAAPVIPTAPKTGITAWFALVLAFAGRESKELLRDPVRLFFALFGPVALMATAALAISFDIRHINVAIFDQDQSTESRLLIQAFEGSSYFHLISPLSDTAQIPTTLKSAQARLVIEIPPHFGRNLLRGEKPEVGFYIDGGEPFFAENLKGMISGVMQTYARRKVLNSGYPADLAPVIQIIPRFAYNQNFQSIYAITPGVIMMALMLIPVMMTTLGVVREKEIGSITNLYSSPASGTQFLLGKQLPYILTSMLSYAVLVWIAVVLLNVPITGGFPAMTLGALLLIFAITAFGLLLSSLLSSQVAAMAAAALLTMIPAMNFSGMLYPVSTIVGAGRVMATIFPATHYHDISLGAFTKGQGFWQFLGSYGALMAFGGVCFFLAVLILRKQEK